MDVTFVTEREGDLSIEIGYFDTVFEIKEKIQKYYKIPVSRQTLIFNGQILLDERDVADCMIFHRSRISLTVLRDDRISNLPDDILSYIISYFTVRDAALASVLSSTWKYHVPCMPRLKFDLLSILQPHADHSLSLKATSGTCRPYKDLFVKGVNQFVQFYKGGGLHQLHVFKVSFCLNRASASDIDRWVSFATDMGVKQLHLKFACSHCLNKYDENILLHHTNAYTLGSDVISKRGAAKVERLSLRSCHLGPGVISQFSSLASLRLHVVTLSVSALENIFSSCLNLESIALVSCELNGTILCIPGSLRRLKHLTVINFRGLNETIISATNLTHLEIDSKTINLSGVNLKEVYFGALKEERMRYVFSQLAKDLPLIETLWVYSPTNSVQCLPEQITTFSKIKLLILSFPRYRPLSLNRLPLSVNKIIAILKACPLLDKFHLVTQSLDSEQGISGPPTPHECVHENLKQVQLGGFHFMPSYIVLAVFIMDYAVALERMVIDPACTITLGRKSWTSSVRMKWKIGEREMVCSELMEHCKSSVLTVK